MSVLTVGQKPDSGRYRINDKGERELTESYIVITDDKTHSPIEIGQATGIPSLFSTYAFGSYTDTSLRVVNVNPQRSGDSPFVWDVEVTYSSKSQDPDSANPDPNPLLRPAEVSIDYEVRSVVITGALNDNGQSVAYENGITDTAGTPFDPPPEKDDYHIVATVTVNVWPVDLDTLFDFNNSVNSSSIFGAEARTLRLRVKAQKQFENDYRFWRVTYEFVHKAETWDLQLLSRGPIYVEGSDLIPFTDYVGDKKLGLLDEDGTAINDTGRAEDGNEVPYFISLKVYKERDFSALGLGNPFTS